ncbi:thioredoxin family protein [Aquimarina sp. 2201CG14-23]|uniref:thioredoxin family protein n=1 Tax=Aquimarina mycalae TaxID=3040073 RepID=UPI002477E709|nr:thioredoxin family protein [Aquimarina sp. 2201CG14-23]MDH7444971.1 thioredoxin family protein [Aquimarina sp. 2201CG14-23]
MKRNILLLFLMISGYGFSQVNWVYDMKMAQAMALEQNKLIIVDFWATWCGPCKQMDKKLWGTEEMSAMSNNFVFLKVDIDQEVDLAKNFNAMSIPLVVLIDASQKKIWSKSGFANASHYLNDFKKIPGNTGNLSENLIPVLQKRNSSVAFFNLGVAYQEIARPLDNNNIKYSLLGVSNDYFDMIIDKSKNEDLVQKAELYTLLNRVFVGKSKKVLKKLEKLEVNEQNDELKELKCFVKAYCYKNQKDKDALAELKKEIKNPNLLSML